MDADKKPKQLNAPFVKTAMKYSSRAAAWVYRKTGGRIGGTWRVGAGFKKPVPTLLLEHRGRKSGKLFASPLVYITDGDDVIIVASMGGRDENPQWYHNLRANPDCTLGDERFAATEVTDPAEYRRLYDQAEKVYAGYRDYKVTTARHGRHIPVFRLTPC